VKAPKAKCAWVIALRKIEKGEELFADYGRWYWATMKPTKVSKKFIEEKLTELNHY
jgi:hypothetical protein